MPEEMAPLGVILNRDLCGQLEKQGILTNAIRNALSDYLARVCRMCRGSGVDVSKIKDDTALDFVTGHFVPNPGDFMSLGVPVDPETDAKLHRHHAYTPDVIRVAAAQTAYGRCPECMGAGVFPTK